jgi:hypothetical protein
MYDSFVELFPFVHSVLAITVSSPCARGNQVGMLSFFNTGDAADLDEGNADNFDVDAAGRGEASDNEVTEDNLTTKQRAVLESFIAKLQLRSQKQLKHWAMVAPLAMHSRGHMKNPPNRPLHGAGCGLQMLWNTLNDLFDSTFAARNNTSSSQYTVSMAFDNWQKMINKKWQSNVCSSIYLKGVAWRYAKLSISRDLVVN